MDTLLVRSTKLYKHPKVVLIVAFALTLFFAAGIPMLKFDNNIRNMLPQNNRDLLMHDYYEDENRFGSSSYIFLGAESDNAYSETSLSYFHKLQVKIEALNQKLPGENTAALLGLTVEEGTKLVEAIKGLGINEMNYREELIPVLTSATSLKEKFGFDDVLSAKIAAAAAKADPEQIYARYEDPIKKLEGLMNADYITSRDDSLVVEKLVDEGSVTLNADGTVTLAPEVVSGLKSKIQSWDIYQGVLVSDDGKLGSLIVKLNTHDINVKASLNKAIQDILVELKTAGVTPYLDGEPVIEEKISRYMVEDLAMLLPLVVIAVLLVLFLCFRNLSGVLYPSIVVLMAVVWAVGAGGWLGIPVTVVGTAMPVLLVAIASAYGIHQMNHYLLDPSHDKMGILVHNMKSVGLAILLSGITVMVGFGSLLSSQFVPVKNFGIMTAWGDLVGVVAALLVLPAMILISKKPKTVEYHEAQKGLITSILNGFVKINRKHSGKVIAVSLVLLAVFAFGCLFVKAELNNVSMFKADDPIAVADTKLNEKLAGTQSLNLILDTDLSDVLARTATSDGAEPVTLTSPAVLNKVEAFSADVVKKFPYVTKVLSFNTMMKKMNQEMTGGDKVNYVIPQDEQLISQYLMIFSGDLQSVLAPNHDKMRVTITMKRVSTDESEAVARYTRDYFTKDFQAANHLQANVTGVAHLYYVANTLLIEGTINSVIICVIVVFFLLLFVLKDFWISLIAMLPIFLTLVINYGMLGLFNIPLNAGTAMVSSVAIGIGVDYSIHYITWYRREIHQKRDIDAALENTILHKGRAILYNMFVIVAGFMVMVVSKFIPLIQFGILVSVCMITTAVGSLVIVPAVMRLLAKKQRPFLYMDKGAAVEE